MRRWYSKKESCQLDVGLSYSQNLQKSNSFEQSLLMAETETGTKYRKLGNNDKMIVKEKLGEKCCEMETQVISND